MNCQSGHPAKFRAFSNPIFITVIVLMIALYSSVSCASFGNINPEVFKLAKQAHQKARTQGLAQNSIITIIDYSLPSTQKRLWVVDLIRERVMFHTYVAHGSGSGDKQAKSFSDRLGSHQTSLGVFKTGSTYQGKHGTSLILHGLEKGVNGNAERRRIVIHSASYVSEGTIKKLGRLGRSHGCPALSYQDTLPVIKTIKNGTLLFAYYPDKSWLKRSKFLS